MLRVPSSVRPDPEACLADLATPLRGKPPFERRIAIVLADDGAADNAAAIVRALRDAGYRTGDAPTDGAALWARLSRGPAEEMLSFADYSAFFASLPPDRQQLVTRRWGAAERDPTFRLGRLDCGRFAIPGFREGNIAVLVGSRETAEAAPRHSEIALDAWIADGFRADAVIDRRA